MYMQSIGLDTRKEFILSHWKKLICWVHAHHGRYHIGSSDAGLELACMQAVKLLPCVASLLTVIQKFSIVQFEHAASHAWTPLS